MTTTAVQPTLADRYVAALKRAQTNRLVAYKLNETTYEVPSASEANRIHTVSVIGPRWFDLHCDCAGGNHLACQHRAVVVFARKYRIHAARPVTSPAIDVQAVINTPAVVAAREAVMAASQTFADAARAAWQERMVRERAICDAQIAAGINPLADILD